MSFLEVAGDACPSCRRGIRPNGATCERCDGIGILDKGGR